MGRNLVTGLLWTHDFTPERPQIHKSYRSNSIDASKIKGFIKQIGHSVCGSTIQYVYIYTVWNKSCIYSQSFKHQFL